MNALKQRPRRRPTFPSVPYVSPICFFVLLKWQNHQRRLGQVVAVVWRSLPPEERQGPSWGGIFQTCAAATAATATSTPGKLPERLKAQSCAALSWAAMARLNVPGSSALRASSRTQPGSQKHTWGAGSTSASVRAGATSSKLFKCSVWLSSPCLT